MPPAGPPPYGQPMYEDPPDRTPSPRSYGSQQRGSSFLGFPRPPPPRPAAPPPPPQLPLIQAPPWCPDHTFRSDNQDCPMCRHVRHYWREQTN
eukprot:12625441-Heterocapsa_arctica.AAC.1